MIEYSGKLVVTTRMAISSMNSQLTDEQVVGSVMMFDLATFTLDETVNLSNRKMCSIPALYQDVLIIGFVQGGCGAYKITSSGLVELFSYEKTGDDAIAELEFQGCTVIGTRAVFAMYKYGIRSYMIHYDGDLSFSLTKEEDLRFANIADFSYNNQRSHFVFSVAADGSKLFFPLASFSWVPDGERHAGVLVASIGDLSDYNVYELPVHAIPDAPADNGTDPQPTYIAVDDQYVWINLGNKGIGCFCCLRLT